MGQRLPQEPEALWTFIHDLADAERLELLAHCVSLTANAIRAPRQCSGESEAHAVLLAHEVGLDMTAYWQPTAASFFGRVSKERIAQAVREAVSGGRAVDRRIFVGRASCNTNDPLVGWICRAMIDGPASVAGGHNYRQSRAQLQAVNGAVNA